MPVPWWNDSIGKALKDRRKAFLVFKCNVLSENLIALKRARAKARVIIKRLKQESWRKYVSTINRYTKLKEVWRKVHSIAGKSKQHLAPCLKVNGLDITSPKDVSNCLATTIQHTSKCHAISGVFLPNKRLLESRKISFQTSENLPYNSPFTRQELTVALSKCSATSQGPDNIHNEMLKHLGPNALNTLLQVFNYKAFSVLQALLHRSMGADANMAASP